MKKKILIISLIVCLIVSMAACGNGSGGNSGGSSDGNQTAPPSTGSEVSSGDGASSETDAEQKSLDKFLGSDKGKDYGYGPIGFDLDGLVEEIGKDKVAALRIGATVNSGSDSWPKMWGEEWNALAEQYGFEATVLWADFDSVKEADNIASFRTQQVDGIGISPVGPAIAQTLTELKDVIPVVACIPVEGAAVSTTVNVDQYAKGRMMADKMAEDADGKELKVMTMNSSFFAPQFSARIEAFNEQVAQYPNIEVVAEVAEATIDGYMNIAKSTLLANPEINAVITPYSDPLMGAYQAAQQLGRNDIWFYGMDADETSIQLMRDGVIKGMHAQFAVPQTDTCFFYLLAAIGGYEVPEVAWESENYSMNYSRAEDCDKLLSVLYPDKYPAQ